MIEWGAYCKYIREKQIMISLFLIRFNQPTLHFQNSDPTYSKVECLTHLSINLRQGHCRLVMLQLCPDRQSWKPNVLQYLPAVIAPHSLYCFPFESVWVCVIVEHCGPKDVGMTTKEVLSSFAGVCLSIDRFCWCDSIITLENTLT